MSPEDPRHGTTAGHRAHVRDGEPRCDACKAAHNAAELERRHGARRPQVKAPRLWTAIPKDAINIRDMHSHNDDPTIVLQGGKWAPGGGIMRWIPQAPVERNWSSVGASQDNESQDTTTQVGPRTSGAGTPSGGLRRPLGHDRRMHTVEETTDVRPAPTCPTCGRVANSSGFVREKAIITGNFICARGHLWLTRWLVAA